MSVELILNEKKHLALFNTLISSDFGTVKLACGQRNILGVYAFFNISKAIYVGRTNKRGLGGRMKNHLTKSHNQAVLAYKLAKEALGYTTGYSGTETRNARMSQTEFVEAFEKMIDYVSKLKVKFVQIDDPDDQYIFEYFAAKKLKTPYNDFNTH